MRQAWELGAAASFRQRSALTEQVIVMKDTPWAPHDVPTCLSENVATPEHCGFSLSGRSGGDAVQYFAEWSAAHTVMRETSGAFRVQFVDPTQLVCRTENCAMVTADGIIKYRDSHHLTATYARFIAHDLWQLLPN
jgi:hypothetical protein